jgi:hypothetical protein
METVTLTQTIKGYGKGWKGLWEHFINLLTGYKKTPAHDHELSISFNHSGCVHGVALKPKE